MGLADNRADSFVGDATRDGGEVITPACVSCKNRITLVSCTRYTTGIPSMVMLNLVTCLSYEAT